MLTVSKCTIIKLILSVITAVDFSRLSRKAPLKASYDGRKMAASFDLNPRANGVSPLHHIYQTSKIQL